MGTTLTNYHLDVSGYSKEQIQERMIMLYRSEGFELQQYETDADMVLYMLFNQSQKWMAICEKDVPSVPIKDLKRRTRTFAECFKTCAIGGMVYDSDVLIMYLHSYTSNNKDFVVLDLENGYQEELGYNRKTSKGKQNIWSTTLGCDEKSLKALWDSEYTFAEERLSDIGKMIGFADTAGFFVFDEEDQECWPKGHELIALPFRSLLKSCPPFEIIKEGVAVIRPHFGNVYTIWNEQQCFSFQNVGGPHTGACFILESESFSNHDFDFSEATIERRKTFNGSISASYPDDYIIHNATFEKVAAPDKTICFMRASFQDFPIPEGIKVNYQTQSTWRKIDDTQFERTIIVRFYLRGDDTITGHMRAFLVPINGAESVDHHGHNTTLIRRDEHDRQIHERFQNKK